MDSSRRNDRARTPHSQRRSKQSAQRRLAKTVGKTVFPNGLTLVSEAHPEFQSLSLAAWLKVGTRNESRGEAGASHFLEHMLFKGTKERSALDIAREVDRVGGEFNAFTAREHTCFHLLLLERDRQFGGEILGDVLLHSQLSAEELERERKVILQEVLMVEESPEELAFDAFFELAYGDHGLGRPILGSPRSIQTMSRRSLLAFFRRHYRPDQVVLSVAGDISHAQVERQFRELGRRAWPGRPQRTSSIVLPHSERPIIQPGRWWIPRPTEQVHLVWGAPAPTQNSKDRVAAHLLNLHLGGGMSSRLFQQIREKNGLAYTVYSSLNPFLDSGLFTVYAATSPSKAPLCLRLVEEEVRQVCEQLLSVEDLRMAKESLKGTILLSADSVESRMTSLALNELAFGRQIPIDETLAAIDRTTPEDLRRVARRMFVAESVVALLGPRPSREQQRRLRVQIPSRFSSGLKIS